MIKFRIQFGLRSRIVTVPINLNTWRQKNVAQTQKEKLLFVRSHIFIGTYLVETTTFVKIHANTAKKSFKFTKKIAHVDDMMIHNFVKYLVRTRIHL